jgi:cell division GTPase FtsZ
MSDLEQLQPYGVVEADARIHAAIKTVGDLMTRPEQLVGVDLADLRVLLGQADGGGGQAVCGHGIASGPDRAVRAARAALADLDDQLAALRAAKTGER